MFRHKFLFFSSIISYLSEIKEPITAVSFQLVFDEKFPIFITNDSGTCFSSLFAVNPQGYDVVGLFMRNWDVRNEKGRCLSDEDREDAAFVCKHLKIPLYEVDFVKQYWNEVFRQV